MSLSVRDYGCSASNIGLLGYSNAYEAQFESDALATISERKQALLTTARVVSEEASTSTAATIIVATTARIQSLLYPI